MNDNSTCFTARFLQDIMKQHETKWCTVLAYAPMSNGRAERMVRTLKQSIRRSVTEGQEWDISIEQVLFGYPGRPIRGGELLLELLYGVKPKDYGRTHHAKDG